MKTVKKELKMLGVALLVLLMAISITSCDENPEEVTQQNILPETFGVDIPSSISSTINVGGGRINGRTEELAGDDIYQHLRLFIFIGASARELTEEIITAIRTYNIESLETITYTSDEDGRTKTMTVLEDVEFEGVTWEYQLTVVDADSENAPDGGKAMQVFWRNSPAVEGIAILKPYNINRNDNENGFQAIYRIDYNSAGKLGYDASMEVSIAGLAYDRPEDDEFSMRNLRMFVGRKGDVVDVFGNSNHPRARLFSDNENPGFNWAFVASGNNNSNIGVAEVGLPPSSLDSDSRADLLEEYSVRNVFTTSITNAFPNITQEQLDAFLVNTNPPGYFDRDGFLIAGSSPGEAWNSLADRIQDLAPYNPLETSSLEITFK